MTLCMAGFGIGWLVVGLSPVYALLLCGMAIVAAASSLWHLPAIAALSNRFAERRGFALSVHGIGSNVGLAGAFEQKPTVLNNSLSTNPLSDDK